uniref:DUF4373 domain-containing protein n=1 Tax=Heterorhabditis bacteriophora TaxID=37862 RepID=A0A1I7X4V6_HETBA
MKEFGLDSMGAKLNKGSVIDRNFPIIQMKRFIDEFNTSTEHDKDDLVDFLRKKLSETHSEFTRQKILKHLTYLGITYEKKAKGWVTCESHNFILMQILIIFSNKSKWSDDLRSELVALKEQYDEMDDEDHELIGLVDYVTRRLSEKKPERQIERELKALGAVFEKKARKSRVKKDLNSSTHFDSDSHEEKKEVINIVLPFMKRKRIVVSSDDEGDIVVPTTNEEQKKKKARLVLSDSEDDI